MVLNFNSVTVIELVRKIFHETFVYGNCTAHKFLDGGKRGNILCKYG